MRKTTEEQVYDAIAADMREFGYLDASADMVKDVHQAVLKKEPPPHGVIGLFMEQHVYTAIERGLLK